jgi:hypothetical protein
MPEQTGASVVFYRPPKFWSDRVRTRKMIVDGQVRAELRRGQEVTVHVAPGRHVAHARISWIGSAEIVFDAPPVRWCD